MHSLFSNLLVVNQFAAQAWTSGTQNATGYDTRTLGVPPRRAGIILDLVTGASTTGNFTVSDSPDNSTWTVIAGATLAAAQLASLTGQYLVDMDLAKRQRYIRVNLVGTGTAGSANVNLVFYEPEYAGVAGYQASTSQTPATNVIVI